ncbi:Serine/threonine-protein kinase tousled-like 2 [Cichlidogyrus casuarinus]|uniref:Serine/threonine-protein kinase tousled-like 2 n=1 Tax=Cichlidogyrus casuarinus TaxID=1844966 RepID=A0ABD2QMP4_9PLAT
MAIHVDPRKHELLEARIQGTNDYKQTPTYTAQFTTNGKSMSSKPLECKVDLEKRQFVDLNENSASLPPVNTQLNQNMTLSHQRVSPSDQENTSSSSMGPSELIERSTPQPRKPSGDTCSRGPLIGHFSTPPIFTSSVPNSSDLKSVQPDPLVHKEATTPKTTSRRKRKTGNDDTNSHPKKVQCREKGTKRIDELFKSKADSPKNTLSMLHASNDSLNNRSHGSPGKNSLVATELVNNHQLASALLKSRDLNSFDVEYAASIDQLHSISPKVSPFEHNSAACQTDLSVSLIPHNDPASALNLERLQRKVSELEHDSELANERVSRYQEQQTKSREIIKNLLIEKSLLERRTTRQKVMEDRLRLGQFVTQRQGVHFEEKWIEGSRFKELDQRRKNIESIREEIERKKKQWNKRKPGLSYDSSKKGAKSSSSSDSGLSSGPGSGSGRDSSVASQASGPGTDSEEPSISIDGFYEQAEIYDIRKQLLMKEDKELQAELERLDRERNLHIREIKRIANEDASRFKSHPVLSDRYLLLNLLGKGGFSEVHKGFDLLENRYVACKIHQLNPSWPKEKKDNYIRHALREIEIHKNLNHNRIVKVFDVFDIDHDAFCTVLEYSEGNDLDFFLKQNKVIPEREAKSIVVQVLSALRYLNERKPPIIHYDLKPGNILLGSGEKSGEIKITDFGLSKVMDDAYAPDVGMDLTSQGAGTYWYLPPECFETCGDEPPKINSKVDIWSVGVIFYQCLFGKKPFGHNMSQADILHQNTILQARHITFPSVPKVSEGAKEFIRRCCTYKKEVRPDVFQLSNDDYLKPKAQLKHHLDLASLPGPSGTPHHPTSLPQNAVTSLVTGNNSNSLPYIPNVAATGGITAMPPTSSS